MPGQSLEPAGRIPPDAMLLPGSKRDRHLRSQSLCTQLADHSGA